MVVPWHAWCRSAPWPALLCPAPTCQGSAGHAGEEALAPARGWDALSCLAQVCERVECGEKVGMEGAHVGVASPLCTGCRSCKFLHLIKLYRIKIS